MPLISRARRRLALATLLSAACVAPQAPASSKPLSGKPSCPTTQDANAASIAATIVTLTNRGRETANLEALKADSALACAAQVQADQMARLDRMAHELPGQKYPTLVTRLKAAGYRYAATGENVAWGQRSATDVISSWMASRPHRANILTPDFREIGAGYAVSATRKTYFVQVFGRRLY